MQYVELHARSAFSFLEGASLPESLASVAAKLNLPAMALLDRNGVYGAPRFQMGAKTYGIKAHFGSEISFSENENLPVLVENLAGYQNLCRLITTAKLRANKETLSTLSLAEFQGKTEGLICLTGDEKGPLAHAIKRGRIEAGRELLTNLTSTFGSKNVYVEIQRHRNDFQESRNEIAIALAREFKLPLLATNGVCYATREEREIADVFTCLKHKRKLDTAGHLLHRNSYRYLRSAKEMSEVFADLPEAIANTSELSSRLNFTLDRENLGYQFPRYPIPDGETMSSFLRKRAWEGARVRYQPVTERVTRQLEKELALIEKLDLAGYFLIVWDIVRFCNVNGILVQGRGSAANSAVCFSLGITAIDPIGMDLLFERFLSEERNEMPDIDLDLPSGDDREKVIQFVYQKYGMRGAAMTANVNTYRERSAAREVGKVLGFDEEAISTLSDRSGSWEWRDPNDTTKKQFTYAGLDLSHPRVAMYASLRDRIKDLPRHLSQHSGGMVICQAQLDSVVPLEPATMVGRVVVQWDKDDCAALGLVKVDLLGLGMMAVLKDTQILIREHYNEEVDLAHLPQAPDVYDTIRKADTIGMFQVESRAQMASLPRNNPTRFYDLVTQVALIRPGPITGHMTNPYLNRRQGKERVTYLHPLLIPILERTLGIPLFQEQLLKIAMVLADFTGGEAEELRRALGSKRSVQRMKEIEVKLRMGMTRKGITTKVQDAAIQYIVSFALYGFPESHAASFALIAYASGYLKVRYIAAFTAALLNNWPMGFYHPRTIIKDAQHHGLSFKPIDVTKSDWNCTLEQTEKGLVVRMGLRYVKGLPQVSAEAIVAQRKIAPFKSVEDLARRVPELDKDDLGTLAAIGALNYLDTDTNFYRRDALWQVEQAIQKVGPLLEGVIEKDSKSPLAQMDFEERLFADLDGTGMTIGPHALTSKRKELKAKGAVTVDTLRNVPNGAYVKVAGEVITRQRPGTANGIIFMTLQDETGITNVLVMPDFYRENMSVVLKAPYTLVEGVIQNQDGVIHILPKSMAQIKVTAAKTYAHNFH